MLLAVDILLLVLLSLPKALDLIFTELSYRIEYVKSVCTLAIIGLTGFLMYRMLYPAPNIIIGVLFFMLFVTVASILSYLFSYVVEMIIGFILLILDFPSDIFDEIIYKLNTTKKIEKKNKKENPILRNLRRNKEAQAGLRYFIEKDKKVQKYYVKFFD